MERAVRLFMEAAGVPRDDAELTQTPERVTSAWVDEFIDGYGRTIEEALGTPSPSAPGNVVYVTHIDYTGVCPHHLLPYRGQAHLAYRTGPHVAGFGRLAVLVDTLAHRLTLQETLAKQIADALVSGLAAQGAGVILEASQTCMTMRGENQSRSRCVVEATTGDFDTAALHQLWMAVKRGASNES